MESASFNVNYTGDYLDVAGHPTTPDMALDLYADKPFIQQGFLTDQSPKPGDSAYWERLYDLEITPEHVAISDALIIFRPRVRAAAFAQGAHRLTVIGRAGKGTDKIDLDACTQHDVAVFNAPDTLTHATASAAFVLILALSKRLTQQMRLVHQARWDLQPQTMGSDLPGKTLGVIGLGASGRELARLAKPWGMKLIAFCPYTRPEDAHTLGVRLTASQDELFEQSDFVSLHNRLDDSTRNSIGMAQFRLMQPHAYFINVARGEIVRETEMIEALKNGVIAGAGLDVFEHEPIAANHPLTALENVILTPHWLASTRDAARLTMSIMSNGILRAAQGLVPDNVVNPEVLDRPGFRKKLSRYACLYGHCDGE